MFVVFFYPDMNGGSVGLSITQVMKFIGMLQWWARQQAELKIQMTSVERVLEYINVPKEAIHLSLLGCFNLHYSIMNYLLLYKYFFIFFYR